MKARGVAMIIGALSVVFVLWLYLDGSSTKDAGIPVAKPKVKTPPPAAGTAAKGVSPPEFHPAPQATLAPNEELLASAAPVPAETNEVEIKIEYPKPTFFSIPVVIKLPNLEPPGSIRPLQSFRAPLGTTNIALGKTVTSSDSAPVIGDLGLITDGDADGLHGAYVELASGPQWVQIDLGADATISKIMMWHYHKEPRAYVDVIVQIATEPDFGSAVTTVFNSDHDNTLGMGVGPDPTYIETNHGRIIDGKGTVGRYVRLTSNGNTMDELNHYCEVSVYGVPSL